MEIAPAPFSGARSRPLQRIGDAERAAVADQLAEHFAAGRLSVDELDERSTLVVAAVTQLDLSRATYDLPALTLLPPARQQTATPWRPGDWIALVIALSCLTVGVFAVLGLIVGGFGSWAVIGFFGGTFAAVGGAAGYHAVRAMAGSH